MQTHRLVSTAATILGLTLTAARSDIYLELGINKRHVQTAGSVVRFDHGELNLFVRDGIVLLAACTSDPELYFYGPHLGCALGITGYVAAGDFNGDGVSDANQYWSIEGVVRALLIAPSRPQECSLLSAPPSKLPRPLRIFRDGAVTVFHDLRTPQVTQYNISRYEMIRRYGSVRQEETLVASGILEPPLAIPIPETGFLQVVVTGADIVGSPLSIDVPVAIEVDGLEIVPFFAEEWGENVRVALAATPAIANFYSVTGTGANIVLTEITPNGNDSTLNLAILPGRTGAGAPGPSFTTDSLPINSSIDTLSGVVSGPPAVALKQMNEELVTGRYVFGFPSLLNPNVPLSIPVTIVPNVEAFGSNPRVKGGFRFTSGSYLDGYYQMDPRVINTIRWEGNDLNKVVPGDNIFFSILNPAEDTITFPPTVPQTPVILSTPAVQSYTLPPSFFDVGEEGVIDLRYQRALPISNISWDRSRREFRTKVRFVDSYAGYAQDAFPLGTTGDTTPAGDFDRDGMSNVEEYAYHFPSNEAISTAARQQFVPQPVPESGIGGFPLLVEEFNRALLAVAEPIIDSDEQPPGVVGPVLDDTGRLVVRVPRRENTGSSLRYDFSEVTTNAKGKTKTKKIKIGPRTPYEVIIEDNVTATREVRIEVNVLNPATREIYFIRPQAIPTIVNLNQDYVTLRSRNPVKPGKPLPNIQVKLTALDLRQ
ncbi:hypothetical protein OKA05_10300 [Luteolibacter arcticus]|uniref:Uncharacterized protein n=1 Tax=Luteolibacter arcticus TaxID=1581411 RepID=A0ABT3GH63_9BACT|nr:hypothetical protein [Luteolibacter arcticus]MCW1922942.1 hypothetical protein [Luteolibacter arcticus]